MTEIINDLDLGATWVYCMPHVGPHESGWCSVDKSQKAPLEANTRTEAVEEVKRNGWPIFGYCDVCYKWLGGGGNVCEEHQGQRPKPRLSRLQCLCRSTGREDTPNPDCPAVIHR